MNFYVNLSMVGPKLTGLGYYSVRCADSIAHNFNCNIVASSYQPQNNIRVYPAPQSVVMGKNSMAAIKRLLYLLNGFPKEADFVYTPTHHGLPKHANQVITIHDLIPLRYPAQHRTQYLYFKYVLPKIINQCRAVFTVSENAKQDICDFYSLPDEHVYVVPNGVDSNSFRPGACGKEERDEPYLLVVGAAYPHKNIHELIRCWFFWKGKYKLKIISAGKYLELLKRLVIECKLETDVVFLEYVSRDKLISLYQGCAALVFPSLWEGFGVPPLEALACGRPVIVSDIPVHREVLGEAACFITPGDISTWERAFIEIEDVCITKRKLQIGLEKINKYTWENTGKMLVSSLVKVEPSLERKN